MSQFNPISTFWNALAEKGKIATLIGLCFVIPVNAKFMLDFFNLVIYSSDRLYMIMAYNAIGMFWFILPSKISIRNGFLGEVNVED